MSRRKHVTLNALQQEVEPPGEGQHIVRAVGSRGSNLIEVRGLRGWGVRAGAGGVVGERMPRSCMCCS